MLLKNEVGLFCKYLFPLNNSVIDVTDAHHSPALCVQAAPWRGFLCLLFNGVSVGILLLEIIVFFF